MSLSAGDYRKIIDLIDVIYSVSDRDLLFKTACEEMQRLVRFPSSALLATECGTGQFVLKDCVGYHFPRQGFVDFVCGYWKEQPIVASGARAKLTRGALRITDVISPALFADKGYYRDYSRDLGVFYETCMDLMSPLGYVGGIGFHREKLDRDFDERDLEIINILQPHFSRAFYHIELLRSGLPNQDRDLKSRFAALGLSDRQQDVAVWVSRGLSNREIARRLFISEQTVKDHVSAILEKLCLKRRSQLVARVMIGRELVEN